MVEASAETLLMNHIRDFILHDEPISIEDLLAALFCQVTPFVLTPSPPSRVIQLVNVKGWPSWDSWVDISPCHKSWTVTHAHTHAVSQSRTHTHSAPQYPPIHPLSHARTQSVFHTRTHSPVGTHPPTRSVTHAVCLSRTHARTQPLGTPPPTQSVTHARTQ